MTPQLVTLTSLPDMRHNTPRGYTTPQEALAEAERTRQACYYHYPKSGAYYVPVDPKEFEHALTA